MTRPEHGRGLPSLYKVDKMYYMAKSARFGPELEEELEKAARALGVSQSELIRDAVAKRCREVLGESLAVRLAPSVGRVLSDGGRAKHTGDAFRHSLARRRRSD